MRTNFLIVIREPPAVEEDTQQFVFFSILLSFELSGKKQFKICYREEF